MVDKEMIEKLDYRKQVMFAVFCARQVIGLVKPEHKEVCLRAIEAVEGFIEGKVTIEQCRVAAYAAAAAAARAAARAAADAAAYAAADAVYAADAAGPDKEAVILEQNRYYNELLNFDKIVEEIMGL